MMENKHEAIRSTFIYFELNNGNEIPCIEKNDIIAIFNFEENELNYIVSKTRSYCKEVSSMTLYNNHFFFDGENNIDAISVVGISFFCKNLTYLHNNLKEYEIIFNGFALDWFYKVDFYKKHSTTIRNANAGRSSNIDWETASEFQVTKGIQSDLKKPKENVEDTSHFFYKKIVVITGTFEKFTLRNDMAKLLHDCGADVNSSISKKTHYVVVGKDAGPKKLEKITELNIPIISEEEFCKIFNV